MQRYDQLYSPQDIICLFVTLCLDSQEDAGQTNEKSFKSVQGYCLVMWYKKTGADICPRMIEYVMSIYYGISRMVALRAA